MADMTFMIKSNRFITLSIVFYEAFLLPIITGRCPRGQWGISLLNLSIINAMPSFIKLSRLGETCAISTIMPICHQKKKRLSAFISTHHNKKTLFHSPTSGDPSYDGSGGSHFFGAHATAPPLGSSVDLRPALVGSLSNCMWATPSTHAPLSFAYP